MASFRISVVRLSAGGAASLAHGSVCPIEIQRSVLAFSWSAASTMPVYGTIDI
jgi:hypothetical protein